MLSVCILLVAFLNHGCVGMGEKTLVISMPPVETTYADQYICYARPLEEFEDISVLSSVTKVDKSIVHHVATGVCESPSTLESTWDCTKQQGSICTGDSINFGGWDEYNQHNGKFVFPNDVSLRVGTKTKLKYFIIQVHFMDPVTNPKSSAANVTLKFMQQPTMFNFQTYSFVINGQIPGKSDKGYFAEAACVWKKPGVNAYRYYLHTHHYGILVEGFLIRNNSWTLLGSQLTLEKKQDLFDLPNGPIEIRPGDILAARCLYINKNEKPIKFGTSAGEEMCSFILDIGYDPRYESEFKRPPGCRAYSPDFRFCDHPETNQFC